MNSTQTAVTVTATQNGETPTTFTLTLTTDVAGYWTRLQAIRDAAHAQLPAGYTLWSVL